MSFLFHFSVGNKNKRCRSNWSLTFHLDQGECELTGHIDVQVNELNFV